MVFWSAKLFSTFLTKFLSKHTQILFYPHFFSTFWGTFSTFSRIFFPRSGHFASLVVLKKSACLPCTRLQHWTCKTSRGTSLRSWFQKKCLLPMGILFFFFPKYPRFWNLKLDFLPLKKVFKFFLKINSIWLLLNNYDQSFRNFAEYFFLQNTPYFETWYWIFSIKKFSAFFFQIGKK